jgi:hypothetical protein
MPRRKSLLAQMYAEHQKAKSERQRVEERAQRAWEADARKTAAQMEREAAQEQRGAERCRGGECQGRHRTYRTGMPAHPGPDGDGARPAQPRVSRRQAATAARSRAGGV